MKTKTLMFVGRVLDVLGRDHDKVFLMEKPTLLTCVVYDHPCNIVKITIMVRFIMSDIMKVELVSISYDVTGDVTQVVTCCDLYFLCYHMQPWIKDCNVCTQQK